MCGGVGGGVRVHNAQEEKERNRLTSSSHRSVIDVKKKIKNVKKEEEISGPRRNEPSPRPVTAASIAQKSKQFIWVKPTFFSLLLQASVEELPLGSGALKPL